MKLRGNIRLFTLIILFLNMLLSIAIAKAQIPGEIEKPDQHFGFEPGTDRMLFDYENLISYFQKLDKASLRLKLVEIGKSPMGKKMYIAFISSVENIKNLEKLKNINRKLALDPNISESEKIAMLRDGKVFFLATLSVHSSEVGPSQSAPLIAYDLATTKDSSKIKWLNDVVFMMVPCHNPDGMDMVVKHYNKYKNTKYEGSLMPGLYHKYAGHDNNRDFVTLTQEDSKHIAWIQSREWFPQVMVEKHQMGSNGVRYVLPPVHDPIAENIDSGIWNWTAIFGANMMADMTKQGLQGIAQHFMFDDYAPIYSAFGTWKNIISFFTEAASVKYATPIFIESNELSVSGKGLSEYKKSINMPSPWTGGTWRLSDIAQYEMASIMSILKTASLHRSEILQNRNELCKKEVLKGKTISPYYYILPLKQHDGSELVNIVNLLKAHGVHVYQLKTSSVFDGKTYEQNDIVIPLAQPFRPFIKEVMESQKYPVRHYTPEGEIIKPYDVTSWSLPLHMGIKAEEIKHTYSENLDSSLSEINDIFKLAKSEIHDYFHAALFSAKNNESYKIAFLALKIGLKVDRLTEALSIDSEHLPVGSFLIYNDKKKSMSLKKLLDETNVSPVYVYSLPDIKATSMKMPNIAVIETFFNDADAGWTRFVFDTYHIPFKTIRPGDFEKTNIAKHNDIIIFPDASKSILMNGKRKKEKEEIISDYPPEYAKGFGKKGLEQLIAFLEKGGIIISWGASSELFHGTLEWKQGEDKKEEFQLPIKNIYKTLKTKGLYCPGSLLKIKLLKNHPITLGMESEIGIFYKGGPIFSTSIPKFDMDRRVIGKFAEKNILLSGYCEKEEIMGDKTCLVWLRKGKGQLVLFGFNPQYRASTNVSFKLLFNSILLPKIMK